MSETTSTIGVILAGGQARRMALNPNHGTDKGLISLGSDTMLRHVIRRLAPQVDQVILNANGPPDRFDDFGLTVIPDVITGQKGPLAGLHAALLWAKQCGAAEVVSVTTDLPFLPQDLVSRLKSQRDQAATAVIACSDGRRHPTVGLWPTTVINRLAEALRTEQRSADKFAHAIAAIEVRFPFSDIGGNRVDPFFNANTKDDIAEARAILSAQT